MALNATFVEKHLHGHQERAVIHAFDLLDLCLRFVGIFERLFQPAGEHRMENGQLESYAVDSLEDEAFEMNIPGRQARSDGRAITK